MLDSISEQLHACQSSLNQYIDEKRSLFPRLYFLSDDDLLELLGQARTGAEGREAVMQTHLKKLFPGISGVRLGPEGMSITALCSQHDDTLQLDHPVDIDCPVEIWLKSLESEMRSSLKSMALKCIVTTSLREQDPFTLPTQILCLAQNIRFTEQTEKALTAKELHNLKANIAKENAYYSTTETEDEGERYKRQALILQCGHYMSVVQILIENNVVSPNDWHWQKQLRFYLIGTKEVVAKMGLASISYSYEYLGINTGQFVRTELADECFLILTQSLHLGMVGNPFGPAGTGKTESVKALGGLVGRLVLVFNCDEAMDAECMGRLLSGLALCGAWGCFDEFNRLSAATLAAVSHQLASLLPAMLPNEKGGERPRATLNGKQIQVSEWCGIAATMNPIGRGYGGRRALPAALERALRPVSMCQPAGRQLAERLLAARSVTHAPAVAGDLHDVFTLASHLLSEQRHYDWGLRALKAAVGSCGAALATRTHDDLQSQRQVARRVLRLNNLSKLTQEDAIRFENILSLVFADVPEEENAKDPISGALDKAIQTLGLIINDSQVQKCMELYEQLQQRMGVVIVGPPGSGKTTIRQLLKYALTLQGKNIIEYVVSPKAMSRSCLLGHIDHDTRQWTDGVISATALEITNQPSDVWSWMVCDGDIDPEWIEALNSVLDDNRLLTLPSGWRIQFGNNVNFVFETHSLEYASPATISRMGIILLSEESSCASEVLDSWLQIVDLESDVLKVAVPILQQAIKTCLKWFQANRSNVPLKLQDVSLMKQILTQFDYIIRDISTSGTHKTPEEMVYLAIERSFLGILKENSIDSFHEELSGVLGPVPRPLATSGQWVSDTLYVSARLAACEGALGACIHSDASHLLLIGPGASAKNLLIEYVLKETNYTVITIDCTPMLQPADVVNELKRNNALRVGGGGGGSGGAVALLMRGLHRAATDHWNCSPLHQLLLQLIQQGGLWARGEEEGGSGMSWWRASRLRVLATAVTAIHSPRLAAALAPLHLREPDDDELQELSRNYLKESIDKQFTDKDVSDITNTMISMYREVVETFYARPHYKWSADHLKRWCENMKWYRPSNNKDLIMAITAEANVIFKNRLISDEEKEQFNAISRNHLNCNSTNDTYYAPKLKDDGVYLEAIDYSEWCSRTQKLINQCLTEDENVFGDTGIEVSTELATLCLAMARTCAGGSSVCVGSAGVGRRAAAHIVGADLPATVFLLNHSQQFMSGIKNALTSAGEGTRTLLVVFELAVTIDVLSAIEAMQCANSIHAIPSNMMPSQNSVHTFDNIKQNLGVVICLDKDQNNLWELVESYPFLHTVDYFVWLDGWSGDTLRQMPPLVIQRLIKENVIVTSKEELKTIPNDGFVKIYESLEADWLRAPCRYIKFIKTYFHILNKKKETLTQRQKMLSAGVEALVRARSEVAVLQRRAGTQEAALRARQQAAAAALDQMTATVRANTTQREDMRALKDTIQAENDKLTIRKKEIEAELASVEPVIAAARAAVGDIRPESLSEIRSLRAPPDVVRDVLEGVLRLMGIADTSWHSMKNFLSKRGVKEDIRCLDASQISAEAVESVEKLLKTRGSSFSPATARRASAACAPLAAWVHANLAHAAALARVRPLQDQQAHLLQNLRSAEAQLSELSGGLSTVEARVAGLQQQLGQHSREAAALELSLAAAHATIAAADDLLRALAHESRAWETDLEHISKEILEVNHRSLLAAAYIVYLPDITEPQTREYLNKWSTLIGFEDPTFSVLNFLSSTETQLKWQAEGLPSDTSAIKNAVLIDQVMKLQKCGFTPLIIDPDGEAIAWLKNNLADTQCDFVSQFSDKLLTAVQYAARLSRPLVVCDVEAVHPSWWPLVVGGGRLVLVGRRPPPLPPHAAAMLSRLDFAAGSHSLTDQLVHYALQELKPEVNEKSKDIKLQKATLQKQQHELQENLLSVLSTNSDILHDANLLSSLNKTRESSATITEALEAAHAIERDIQTATEAYRPSAARIALLALTVKKLATHQPLISLPVEVVLDLFVDGLRRADPNNINNDDLIKYVTRRIIERVLLGLHKNDKYKIVLYILKQVYDDLIPNKLWQLYLGNYISHEDQGAINEMKSNFSWIPDDIIKKVVQLKMTNEEFFKKLSLQNTELWKGFLASGDLNVLSRISLTYFETVLAVSILRPDSSYRAVVSLVDDVLGAECVGGGGGGGAVGRAARWAGARGRRPALLLAAHAQDVLAAHAYHHARPLTYVGIEEGFHSWERAVNGARGGSWVALIVGASPFTQDLLNFIAAFVQRPLDDFNDDFRLWIVCEDREIPPVVANVCVNVILEAPEGVKHNLTSTLSAWGDYEADGDSVRARVCLALFHAIVQERRAYIPQGWSQWYSWEWGEVSAGARALGGGGGAGRALVLALYGARVCARDRRALAALHRAALAEHARAHAWRPLGLPLALPPPTTTRLQPYISAFDALPNIDPPQLLGLPENCRIFWERNAANELINGLKELDTTVVVAKGDDKNNVTPLKVILALWKKLMSGSELLKGNYQVIQEHGSGTDTWWATVCACEATSAARTAKLLHRSLAARARNPALGPSLHKTPAQWQEWWSGPADSATYIREFCLRALAAHQRLPHARTLPPEVDLRTFLQPGRMVWAVRAREAARVRVPARDLALLTTWDPSPEERSSGVVVVGLQLAGAGWARGLCAARPEQPPRAPAPPLLLRHSAQATAAAGVEVCVWGGAGEPLLSARAPLAPHMTPDLAHMHAVSLTIAPLH